jgi:hypothetical protein
MRKPPFLERRPLALALVPDGAPRFKSSEKIWKILGLRENTHSAKFLVPKTPFFSEAAIRARQIFPNFSQAISGDFNGLASKKFGKNAVEGFSSPAQPRSATPTAVCLTDLKPILTEFEPSKKDLFVPSS